MSPEVEFAEDCRTSSKPIGQKFCTHDVVWCPLSAQLWGLWRKCRGKGGKSGKTAILGVFGGICVHYRFISLTCASKARVPKPNPPITRVLFCHFPLFHCFNQGRKFTRGGPDPITAHRYSYSVGVACRSVPWSSWPVYFIIWKNEIGWPSWKKFLDRINKRLEQMTARIILTILPRSPYLSQVCSSFAVNNHNCPQVISLGWLADLCPGLLDPFISSSERMK